MGEFLCVNDITRRIAKIDVVHLLIRTKESNAVSKDIEVVINILSFTIRLVEVSQSPLMTLITDIELEESEYYSIFEVDDEAKLWHEVGDEAEIEEGDVARDPIGIFEKGNMLEDIEAQQTLIVNQKGETSARSNKCINVASVDIVVESNQDGKSKFCDVGSPAPASAPQVNTSDFVGSLTHVNPTLLGLEYVSG